MGFHYGPDRQPIPDEIASMADEQQAEVALTNYRSQEAQREQEMSAAVEAERVKEAEALAEAERREKQDMEDEIERRAQARAAEIIAGGKNTAGDEDKSDAVEPELELTDILASCTTAAQLDESLTGVSWQRIKAAVEGLGMEPGDKKANIALLAEHLGLV